MIVTRTRPDLVDRGALVAEEVASDRIGGNGVVATAAVDRVDDDAVQKTVRDGRDVDHVRP